MSPDPLGNGTLTAVGERGVAVPTYDRTTLVPRIVHIGVGGFHRSHLAVYCDDLAAAGGDWGICGVGLLDGDAPMADALAAQDHLYTLTTRDNDTHRSRIIGSIVDYLHAPGDTTAVVDRIASARTAVVSLTVTESGYEDVARNHRTFDTIAAGLAARRKAGLDGVTVMSCDNLTANGEAARRCVLAAARRLDADLAPWIEATCTFPHSMVDRITPATADADRAHLVEAFGYLDRWPVVAEPFRQWVIEDRFASSSPELTAVGAIVTHDVHRWEQYKLRLLNAAHTVLAHRAALSGFDHVDQAVADPGLREFLGSFLLTEAAPTVDPIPGHPPDQYAAQVIERFANTGIRDRIHRISADSSTKFATFVMPIVCDQLERNGPIRRAAEALAAWARYLAVVPAERHAPDPLGGLARSLAIEAIDDPVVFLDPRLGIPPTVSRHERFVAAFHLASTQTPE